MAAIDEYGDPYRSVGWGASNPWASSPGTYAGPTQAPSISTAPGQGPLPGVTLPQVPAEPYWPASAPAAKPPPLGAPNAPSFGSDPGVVAATSAQNLGLAQANQSLTDARNQAIIRWGDPGLASAAGFGLDPQAAAFAKQNYLSGNADLARLDKAKEDRKRALINRLASRGILFSGETGYEEGQNTSQYGQARYDAQNALLDYLKSLTNNNLSEQAALRAQTMSAYQSAYDRYASNPYAYLGYPDPNQGY